MKTKKQLSPIMEAFIVLLVLFSGLLLWFANEFGLDSGSLYSEPLPEEIDRLEIYTYSDDTRESEWIGTVSEPKRIERYRKAYRWTNDSAICCMEDTRYIIYEYAGDERIGASCYSYFLSRYNNIAFKVQQLLLILFH